MTYVEKLQEWTRDQVENHGLVDVKFFAGNGLDPLPEGTTLEQLAEQAYTVLTSEGVDVSEENL